MDDTYNKGRNQHTIPGVLRDPSGKAVQPQPVSYETTPIPNDHAQSSLIYAQDSFGIPGGAQTFIKARPDASPKQPEQSLSQPGSLPAQPRQTSSRKLRTEHAYRLLVIAIVVALLSGSMLAAFFVTGSLGGIAHNHTNQPLAKAQATATTRSTQGHTTAPKPAPTSGSTQTNLPVTPQPTQISSNPGSNPTPSSGANSLPQFVNLPQQYSCDSNHPPQIMVQTLPGASVRLDATFYYTISQATFSNPTVQSTADNTGIATINAQAAAGGCPDTADPAPNTANLVATAPNSGGVLVQIQVSLPIQVING